MTPSPIYTPTPGLRTSLDVFREFVNRRFNLQLATYQDLHEFSIHRLNDFWMTFWWYSGVVSSVSPTKAIDDGSIIDQFPTFFEGAILNFAENILCRGRSGLAVIDIDEENIRHPREYSWSDLYQLVQTYADALWSSGLREGDVVALVGKNCVRTLALFLATASIGAIFSSFATDIGDKALDDRLQQLQPRVLITTATYSYNGRIHEISRKLNVAIDRLQQSKGCEGIIMNPVKSMSSKWTLWDTFIARGRGRELEFAQLPFNAPLVVMFSSGTTGAPKGIVHSHGGIIMNGLKEFLLHNDLGPGDLHFHYTNIGWTLWNISIGALLTGASVILYDGSPFYPTAEKFLELLFQHRITSFGAGPRYFSEIQKANVMPKIHAQQLHSIVSTGAVLTPSVAEWIAKAFGPVCQISMSGGTELCGSFLHGTRSLPSYPGQLAVKALAMDVVVTSEDGTVLPDGQSGELVCRNPFPNMPAMFLNDPKRKRYFDAYFASIPHVWVHGDFIQVDPVTKGVFVLGRSDGVLNPSGVRFGSADIYSTLSMSIFSAQITDCIVVGQQRVDTKYSDPAERVALFVKTTAQATTGSLQLHPELESRIRAQIEKEFSRRHVPTFLFEAPEIPYNANGKKLEIQVKKVLCGGRSALEKLKLTEEEFRVIKWFEKFYEIEKVTQSLNRLGSKL